MASNAFTNVGPPAGPERRRNLPAPTTQRLLLTVSTDDHGGWTAQARLADGSVRHFDSPFELARFVARVRESPAAVSGLR